MTVRLDDAHNFFDSPTFNQWDGSFHPPFRVKYVEGQTVISQVLISESSVEVGDVITRIDGIAIEDRRAELLKYAHGGNDPVKNRNLNSLILWGPSGSFELEIENETGSQTVSLTRNSSNFSILTFQAENEPVTWDTITTGGCRYGYINMGLLETEQIPDLYDDFVDTDALIFDIRNYPNGTLWTLVNYLFDEPVQLASFSIPDIQYPGTIWWASVQLGAGPPLSYDGDIYILFDEDTQSQAEYTVMGLEQHPNATKVGSTTAGADGNVSQVFLPGQIKTYFTGLGTFYYDQTPTQRIGILPDVFLTPTIQGIREGRDELLAYVLSECEPVNTDEPSAADPIQSIYPLPFGQALTITWKEEVQEGRLELLDPLGKLIRVKVVEGARQLTWSLGDLPGGSYLVRFVTDEGSYTQKVVRK